MTDDRLAELADRLTALAEDTETLEKQLRRLQQRYLSLCRDMDEAGIDEVRR